MDLSKILAISGRPGLYKIISQTGQNVIVESLSDQKKFPVFASYKITTLNDISIFTNEKDVPLADVFKAIFQKEKGETSISPNADKQELFGYFEEVLPDYDKDRVYHTDIKKVLKWYNLLYSKNLLDFTEEEEKKEAPEKEAKLAKSSDAEKKENDENPS